VRSPLFASPVLLALLACHPSPEPADPNTTTTTTGGDAVVEPDSGKPVKADEVTLSPTQAEVTVAVGTTLLYSFKWHASVGQGADQKVADEAVVRYVRMDEAFAQSEEDRAGKPGSDAATGTYVFEAVAPGTTTVQIDETFRGSVEKSTTFTITVRP
jgi:hypothetical protein